MSGTRALFASIGASVLLVAAAALSLLAVSAVFAFGGWSDPVAQSAPQTALILADGQSDATRTTGREPIVLPARAPAQAERPVATSPARTGSAVGAQAVITRSSDSRPPKASFTPPHAGDPSAQAVTPPAPASAPRKSAGDGVRTAGEDLSGKVQGTGDALAQITDPLLPPVAAATQKVLNVVAELLRRTTDGLGNTVDGLLAPR